VPFKASPGRLPLALPSAASVISKSPPVVSLVFHVPVYWLDEELFEQPAIAMANASATAAVVVFPIIRMEFSPFMDYGRRAPEVYNVLPRPEFQMSEMKADNARKRQGAP
jgi:hypothetical protein